jgi:hypothetical protein
MRTTHTLSIWTVTLSGAVLQNLFVSKLVKKVSSNILMTVCSSAGHWSLIWVTRNHSRPCIIFICKIDCKYYYSICVNIYFNLFSSHLITKLRRIFFPNSLLIIIMLSSLNKSNRNLLQAMDLHNLFIQLRIILNNNLTPWSRFILNKIIHLPLVEKFSAFYEL